jgi:PAS domain S-box-containing protein
MLSCLSAATLEVRPLPDASTNHLLLVEDEALIAMGEKLVLERLGYRVTIAATGEQAVSTVERDASVRLVLMDVDLGRGMDGTEAAARILALRDVPVVFLSSHTEPEVVSKTEAVTSYGYVVKESGPTVLDASIKMAFRLHEARARERRTAAALERNMRTSADLVERITSGLFIYRYEAPDRLVLELVNPEATRLTGIAPETWIGREFNELWPNARAIGLTDRYMRVLRDGEPYETEDLYYSDERLSGAYHIRAFPLPEERLAVAFEDVTERVRSREILEQNHSLLTDILELVMAGYWDWNIAKGTEYLSPAFKKMFGYEDDELPNSPETWQRLIFPEDLPIVLERFERHVKSRGLEPYYNEVRYRHKDGSTVWVLCAGRVVEWAEDGSPIRMLGFHLDITERMKSRLVTEASSRFDT